MCSTNARPAPSRLVLYDHHYKDNNQHQSQQHIGCYGEWVMQRGDLDKAISHLVIQPCKKVHSTKIGLQSICDGSGSENKLHPKNLTNPHAFEVPPSTFAPAWTTMRAA